MKFKNILFGAALAFVALSSQAQMNLPKTVIDGNEYYYYVTGSNESIYDIAAKLEVTKDYIIKNNPDAADGITSGMTLRFPTGENKSGNVLTEQKHNSGTTHLVEQGETLYGLAKRYGAGARCLWAQLNVQRKPNCSSQ